MARILSLFLGLVLSAWGLAGSVMAQEAADPLDQLILQGIEQNFAGDWDAADATFAKVAQMEPSHPAGAFFPVTTAFWRRGLESEAVRDDPQIGDAMLQAKLERTVRLAEARAEEDPADAEAYLYWGQALTYIGRLEAENGNYIAGGTKGEEGREMLERALELDPELADAKFPVGAYYFFASLMPRALQWFDFLPFVPSGNREDGLRLLEECFEDCYVNKLGAELVLFAVYGFHSPGEEARGLEIGAMLRERFPDNGLLHVEESFVQLKSGRLAEARAAAADIVAKADAGVRTYGPAVGRFGRMSGARAAFLSGEVETALRELDELEARGPVTPEWVAAWVDLTRAQILDVRGERDRAEEIYERVAESDSGTRGGRARKMAKAFLDEAFVLEVADR